MTDQETIDRFIFMRSQGWSYSKIAVELKISKPTLIKWGRLHQFQIQNLRATETEALAEVVFRPRHERWRTLAKQLAKVEEEIDKRDLDEIPASRLHGIAAQLRAEINKEIGNLQFSESRGNIPMQEQVITTEQWQG